MATQKVEARLGDLVAAIGPRHRKAWLRHVDSLAPEDRAAIEWDLAALPAAAWHALKSNILGQIDRRQPSRGWPQVLDLLHEARAYRYLAGLGCTEIRFSLPTMNARSPDLTARLGTRCVLCEVKTIRLRPARALPSTFPGKLRARLKDAASQLAADGDQAAMRLVYLVLDDGDGLTAEILEIARKSIPDGLRLVIDAGAQVTEIT